MGRFRVAPMARNLLLKHRISTNCLWWRERALCKMAPQGIHFQRLLGYGETSKEDVMYI